VIVGKLEGATIYMSGPMEYAHDAGVEWRRKFSRLVIESGLKIHLIDPTNKPGEDPQKIAEEKSHQQQLQKDGKFEELRQFVKSYRRKDLRYVDISDAVVAVINPEICQCGTLNEVYVAESQHKPVITICEGGLYKLPRWLFDVLDLELIFESVEEVVEKLVQLDRQKEPLDERWVLVRKYL
jgi:nucleoside 2-deoxyribosyltransferase